jgi:hypothetical protein
MVDLLLNVKKAMVLEVFSTLLEKLRSESINLCTRKRLNTVYQIASDARHKVDQQGGEFEHLL